MQASRPGRCKARFLEVPAHRARPACDRPRLVEVGAEAGLAQLHVGLKDVIAGHALAVAPAAGLVRPEIGPAHLLGVAGRAIEIPVHELALGRDPGQR